MPHRYLRVTQCRGGNAINETGGDRVRFFVGLHQPSDCKHLSDVFVSVNRLKERKSFTVGDWIMDSGAFTTVNKFAGYPEEPEEYAKEIKRWSKNGNFLAAISQDYMCEEFVLQKTGLTIPDHQRLTIERYDKIIACDTGGVYIMPVLQGYHPNDYVNHIRQYGDRLIKGMWVGVGSVCKRNANPAAILDVLKAIHDERPDLQLHGFGLKKTALKHKQIRDYLHTSDSMAWSLNARMNGRNANDWHEASAFADEIRGWHVT